MNAIRSYLSSSLLSLAIGASLFTLSGVAWAQDPCAPGGTMMKAAEEAQKVRAKEIEDHARNVYGPMAESPDWLSGLNSLLAKCVADQFQWRSAGGNVLFDFAKNLAIEMASDKICAEQRKKVSQITSKASGYLSQIRNFENIGSQQIPFPTGTGSGLTYDDLGGMIGGSMPNGMPLPGGTGSPFPPSNPNPASGGNYNPGFAPAQPAPQGSGIPGVSPPAGR